MRTVHTVKEYLEMNERRRNVLSVIASGEFFYLVNGVWVGEVKFNELMPGAEFKKAGNIYGDNPNRKANFINNVKSY